MTELAVELVDRLGVGMEALWSLMRSAEAGILSLSLVPPLDEDFALTDAARLLGDALEELESGQPGGAISIDFGPPNWDELYAFRVQITVSLGAAMNLIDRLLKEQSEELETSELLALARVVPLVSAAHRLVVRQ